MANANIKNEAEKLHRQLRAMKLDSKADYPGFLAGRTEAYINFYRHLFCEHEVLFYKHLFQQGYQLAGTSDAKFVENMYRILREWNRIPCINRHNFLKSGFAERKLEMAREICELVQKEIQQLRGQKSSKKSLPGGMSRVDVRERKVGSQRSSVLEVQKQVAVAPSESQTRLENKPLYRVFKTSTYPANSTSSNTKHTVGVNSEYPRVFVQRYTGESCDDIVTGNSIESTDEKADNVLESGAPFIPVSTPKSAQVDSDKDAHMLLKIASRLDAALDRISLLESRISLIESDHRANCEKTSFRRPTSQHENRHIEASDERDYSYRPVKLSVPQTVSSHEFNRLRDGDFGSPKNELHPPKAVINGSGDNTTAEPGSFLANYSSKPLFSEIIDKEERVDPLQRNRLNNSPSKKDEDDTYRQSLDDNENIEDSAVGVSSYKDQVGRINSILFETQQILKRQKADAAC